MHFNSGLLLQLDLLIVSLLNFHRMIWLSKYVHIITFPLLLLGKLLIACTYTYKQKANNYFG